MLKKCDHCSGIVGYNALTAQSLPARKVANYGNSVCTICAMTQVRDVADSIRVISVNGRPPDVGLQSGYIARAISAPHLKECHCLHPLETDLHKVIISKFIWSPAEILGKMRPTAFF